MLKALNQYNKLIHIIESKPEDTYICPICQEKLIRNFGAQKQYYSHPKDKGETCELKLNIQLKKEAEELSTQQESILQKFYDKDFSENEIQYSDYTSEQGYFLTQQQKDIIFSKEDRVVVSALAGCVDCDTEFFNGFEWKKISEYKKGDKVLQFNDDWKAELVDPEQYIKIPCDNLTQYKTKYGVDMVLSEEHSIIYVDTSHNKNNYWGNNKLLKIKEEDMRQRHIHNKTGFTGKFITTFDYNSDFKTGLTENELRLIVAIMADGNFNSQKSNWCRINLKKDYKKERLKLLLKLCSIEYKETQWNPKDLQYINICFYAPLHLKHFPKEWYNLNQNEREIIFDEIKNWDGNSGIGNRGIIYRTSTKEDADFIQFIMSSLRKRSTINVSKEIGKESILSTNGKAYIRKSLLYCVSEVKRGNLVSIGQQSKEENKNKVISKYNTLDGYKYCFTVPSGMLILRRNNNIFITGNSAKSSTLYYYCKERPFKKFLYLVYNKSQQIEASETFGKLRNVEIKTIHGLAYKHVGKFYQQKLTFSYGVVDIVKDLNLNWNTDMQLASQIKEFMNEYMLSDLDTFDELRCYDEITGFDRRNVINHCERLWSLKKIYKNNVKVEHDFYLKLFQLSKSDLSSEYKGILVDECQDSSLLTLSLLLSSKVSNIALVGDIYQSLYQWRRSTNIMGLLPHATEYKLTTSFRVSQNIAEISNMLVNAMTGTSINMTGFNAKQKIVSTVNRDNQYALLCRTNAMIFAEVVDNSHKKIFYNGGFKGYNFNNIKDAYSFCLGNSTNNPIFKKFKSYNQMIEYAKQVEDVELLSLDRVINKYGNRIPKIVDGLENNAVTDPKKCDIWISTIHKSKGSTITMPLIISNDHYDLSKLDKDREAGKDVTSESCIIYVGITRCAGEIELSEGLKEFLARELANNQTKENIE